MNTKEKDVIRELAKRYVEMATSEKQQKMNARMISSDKRFIAENI